MNPKIELLFFGDCPNRDATLNKLREVLWMKGLGDARIELIEIDDPDDAVKRRFLGSPTVRIDGQDIDPDARSRVEFGLMCRTYLGSKGHRTGIPPVAMLEKAVGEQLLVHTATEPRSPAS